MKIKQLWQFARSVWSIYRKAIKDQDLWEFMCGPEYLTVLAAREQQYRVVFRSEPPREFSAHSPRVREQMLRLATQLGAGGLCENSAIAVVKGAELRLSKVGAHGIEPIIDPLVSAVARGYMKRSEVNQILEYLPQIRKDVRDFYGIDPIAKEGIAFGIILEWLAL